MNLREQLEIAYSIYAQEQGVLLGGAGFKESPKDSEGVKNYKEYQEVSRKLVGLIEEELVIEQQETAILVKRVQEADKVLPGITSKAMQQDIMREKERITQRLSDLATRHDFLSMEKERFSVKG